MYKPSKYSLLLLIWLTLFAWMDVQAFSLNKIVVHFAADKSPREDIEVINTGKETVYLSIQPFLVTNPGTDEERRVSYTNPQEAGLLVTPNRMILKPGAMRRVRMVRLDKSAGKGDKIFRVLFKPEVGKIKAETTAVKIVVAYEVLVLMQPRNPDPSLQCVEKESSCYLRTRAIPTYCCARVFSAQQKIRRRSSANACRAGVCIMATNGQLSCPMIRRSSITTA